MATRYYNTTAKQIIRNSIRSAIFIDDNLSVPFKTKASEGDLKLSRALYNSFVKNDVSIDFYKYSSKKNWEQSKEYLFKGRDLIVLDWQLENNDIEENTLKLLETAIKTPSLHFVCIYTSKRVDEFPDIAYSIKAYFSKYNNAVIKNPTESLITFLDDNLEKGLTEEIKGKLKAAFKEYTLHNATDKTKKFNQLEEDLKNILSTELSPKVKGEIGKHFKEKIEFAYEAFGYGLSDEFLSNTNTDKFSVDFFLDGNFIIIDNTIILITNKSKPSPGTLYTFFTEAVLKSTGNFLSLLSLDLKSILRDSSGFISKEMDVIDETAFFYHKDSILPKEAFFDFVLDLWKSNLTSLLYSQSDLIKLFDESKLSEYRKQKKIDQKIKTFQKKGNAKVDIDLSKLNYYYNIIENRNLNDFVRFGDVFNLLQDNDKHSEEFLLCITAHCDCLHIENIKNQFFFIKGKKTTVAKALAEGDAGNNSFIKIDNDIVCIEWSHKPFTIYLANNKILKGPQTVNIAGKDRKIAYVASIKENYVQRAANSAFSHPMRVGIFFAKKG